jgi:hypothetical protein
MWEFLELPGRSVWCIDQLVYTYTTNMFHFGANWMHRRHTIRFTICLIVPYWEVAYFGYFLWCKFTNKYYKLSSTDLWCCPESYDSLLCVLNWWLAAFLIPATAGVESRHRLCSATRHHRHTRTHHHPPARLGGGYNVSKVILIDTFVQKEWLWPLFLHVFIFHN